MPWKEQSIMEVREEFCQLAEQEGRNVRALCRRYGISPTTGYTWLARYRQAGPAGLADRSRRPHTSPGQTPAAMEAQVVALRQAHPKWGGRKLRARLLALGTSPPVPSASSMTRILHRQQLITPEASAQATPWIRFCAPQPNDLGQMDFKGHFALTTAARCQPLTVLDDHSRFALGIRALSSQQAALVKPELIALFRRYGLPNRILCDNTGPWGTATPGRYTALGIWLLHLDVRVIHGRPYHPQTQGKEERFHRTLATEVLQAQSFGSLAQVQDAFDAWRTVYNLQRPHEALDLQPPGSRYQLSPRVYPETLPPVEYDQGELVRRVHSRGEISLQGRFYHLGEGLCGQPVALRPTADPAILAVYFRHYLVAQLDLHHPAEAG